MADVIQFLGALNSSAKMTAADLNAVTTAAVAAVVATNGTSARTGSPGGGGAGSGGGMGVPSGSGGGIVPKFGTVTVTPLGAGALIADLKSLQGRR